MYDVNDADAGAYSDCGADGAAADAHDGPDDDADVDHDADAAEHDR